MYFPLLSQECGRQLCKQLQTRRKASKRRLRAWVEDFSAAHEGAFPTDEDYRADSKSAALLAEYNAARSAVERIEKEKSLGQVDWLGVTYLSSRSQKRHLTLNLAFSI